MQTSYFLSKTDIWTGVSKKTTNVAVFFMLTHYVQIRQFPLRSSHF